MHLVPFMSSFLFSRVLGLDGNNDRDRDGMMMLFCHVGGEWM